jgi:glucosamine--fructose-6-phosphate aminotransferase (isomerizing)
MVFNRIKAFFEKINISGVYFGRSLKTVPKGGLVFFPYDPTILGCGIAGVLAFNRPPSKAKALAYVEDLERKMETLQAHCWECLRKAGADLGEYLGGQILLKEMRAVGARFKGQDVFYEVFSEKSCRDRLAALCAMLETIIESEKSVLAKQKGRFAAADHELVMFRVSQLKDLLWALRQDVLENVEKISAMGRFDETGITPESVALLKELNLVFNNLDRLEVRGRDSSGVSLLFVVHKAVYSQFHQKLKEAALLHRFEERLAGSILINNSIRINNHGSERVSVAFTYKVAAEVGSLGDNVRYLRKQVLDDSLLLKLIQCPLVDHSIVAHTRWASVGEISVPNCHPVDNGTNGSPDSRGIIHVCLNGDIDNFQLLKQEFERETGSKIPEQITTDTKIIPLQVERYLAQGATIDEAFRLAVNDFTGSHAIVMHTDLAPGKIYLSQKGSGQAIFIGLAEDHYIPASETYGFVEETSRYLKLDGEKVVDGISGKTQGQIFVLDSHSVGGLEGIKATHYDGTPIELLEGDIINTEITSRDIDRQQYSHYFLKEISESPRSVDQTIQGRLAVAEDDGQRRPQILLDRSAFPESLESALEKKEIRKVFFIGQGTAGVAASGCTMLLRDYLSQTQIRVGSFKASEFSGFMLGDSMDDTLVVAISQSGTTTDTNRAVDMARGQGAHTLAIVNRRDSDVTFQVDGVLYTSTGRDIEMSVASTKAYYSQIVAGSILGLRIAQLTGARTDDFIVEEIEHLWRLSTSMNKILANRDAIRKSAQQFAVTKTYWAIVGSGPNKVSADEIRIKLSELCYKSISSDVVEDKKHIDLSSEPLIFVCAAGNRDEVVSDIVKDTAIFKAHEAVPIVVTTEGEHRFDPYADSVIWVPEVNERFAPILNTLAGHLWGYYAALAINEESQYLFDYREEIREHIESSVDKGLDVYEIVLDKIFREKAARFYRAFKERITQNRYATAMAIRAASDLTLLLKYLAGRLPVEDFEFDFGVKGTAPNMLEAFLRCIGKIINEMARPVDAIKHQAKTVTVGTSRLATKVEGLLFESLEMYGFSANQLTTSNILVLRRLQAIVSEVEGATVYRIDGLTILGEPIDESTIHVVTKTGTSEFLVSRAESDNSLRGTKRIIVRKGNVFIGSGKRDNRSILVVPIISAGTTIDHLVLFHVGFEKELDLQKKVDALGGKYQHIRNLVEETSLVWADAYLNMLPIEDLFGMSAEKVSERIAAQLWSDSSSN